VSTDAMVAELFEPVRRCEELFAFGRGDKRGDDLAESDSRSGCGTKAPKFELFLR
jgi:hypothetical protein